MRTRLCTIRILDEVNCAIIGLHPDHVGYFYEEYGRFAPNYFFNPRYKFGPWDGKIRYFQKTGKTYVYLLDEIIPRIVGLGYKIKLDDQRKGIQVMPKLLTEDYFSTKGVVDNNGKPWIMRDYQVDLVNALISEGYGVGIAGTGAGKTSVCAALALAYEEKANFRSIIIVPDKNLTEQTVREYNRFGVDVGEYSGTKKNLTPKHIVSTWQALQNNPQIINLFNVVIVDECHKLKGQVLTDLLNVHGKNIAHRFGVTGTLPKEETDRQAVVVAVGPVCYAIPAHKLIEQGHLAKLHIDIMQLSTDLHDEYNEFLKEWHEVNKPLSNSKPPTYKQFKDGYFPEWSAEKRYLQQEPDRLQWIVDYIELRRDMRNGNVLCLVNGIQVGKTLAKMVSNAHFVYGQDKMKVRRQIYQLFDDNSDIVVFATINIASTGLDIPRIFNLMFIDVGKSFIRTIQSIGRGLRKADDKDFVLVSDICSDFKYSKRHVRERTKYYREAQYPFTKRVVEYS